MGEGERWWRGEIGEGEGGRGGGGRIVETGINLELVHCLNKLLEELLTNGFVDEDDLEGSAALAIEAQGPKNALAYSHIHVCIWQDDCWI